MESGPRNGPPSRKAAPVKTSSAVTRIASASMNRLTLTVRALVRSDQEIMAAHTTTIPTINQNEERTGSRASPAISIRAANPPADRDTTGDERKWSRTAEKGDATAVRVGGC